MTAQDVLFMAWEKGYRLQPREGNVRISRADGASIPPGLITEVRAHKPGLLALLDKLESCGAADDGLILGALALFTAEPKGLVKSPGMPFPAPVRPPIALGASGGDRSKAQWQNKERFGEE